MLAYLRGTIAAKEMSGGTVDQVVLDVSGVGFELQVSHRTFLAIGLPGDEVMAHTALVVRENDWSLFGFADREDREMFNLVQSVSGIGPKLALALCGTFSPDDLSDAILSEDYKLLSQAPGVGAKVAQRLVLELKAKMEDWKLKQVSTGSARPAEASAAYEEVRIILSGLGYTGTEINLALKSAGEKNIDQDVELLVRHSLQTLGAAVP